MNHHNSNRVSHCICLFPPLRAAPSGAKPDYYVFITDISPTLFADLRDREAWLKKTKLPKQNISIEIDAHYGAENAGSKVKFPVRRSSGLVDLVVSYRMAAWGTSRPEAEVWAKMAFKPSAALLSSDSTYPRFQEIRSRIESSRPSNRKTPISKGARPGSISSKGMINAKASAAPSDKGHDEGGTLFLLEWVAYAKGPQDLKVLASRYLSNTEVTWQWK
ncbi:hypothetical protein LTR50_004881 [Elasticomyces elasticus]|nr:hypothetical protein LTR50_004881 [Elasticomyces elasticus]